MSVMTCVVDNGYSQAQKVGFRPRLCENSDPVAHMCRVRKFWVFIEHERSKNESTRVVLSKK
jgi:hypothetical protein